MKDKATEVRDEVKTEETPSEPTPEVKEPTPKTPETFTKAQADKMVQDALKREGGRINKTLEERVVSLESENTKLKDNELTVIAKQFGLTVEQVKEAGITDPSKVEAMAVLFGKTESPTPLKLDPGTTTGGGKEVPKSAKGKYAAGFAELSKKK